MLLLLQTVSVVYLWSLTLYSTLSAARFAIFLAVDLLSFSMVAYVYTRDRWKEVVSQRWMLFGSIGLIVLLITSLFAT